jgi:MraZ protein
MLTLRGNSPATIDEKGRLKLPSIFRSALEKTLKNKAKNKNINNIDFYLTSFDLGKSLVLFPLVIWEQHEKVLVNLPFMHPSKRKMIHSLSFHGSEVTPDNQGRLVIPQKLREQAKLVGEISILGMIDHLALWNTTSYQELSSQDPVTPEDLMTLSSLGAK